MGCDIHWVLERQTDKGWLGAMSSVETDFIAGKRWYSFFTELGMPFRGESDTAVALNGFPADASELAAYLYSEDRGDAHSPSYLPLADFVSAYDRAEKKLPYQAQRDDNRSEQLPTELFGGWFWSWEFHPYRVVFWFDN